ncbi:hypothetical protein PR048_023669 [Dryococelus australis]|uniref:PiggyBac transposable element-derived protein domain-containing protein n=1 Tax=Dryococelus australis TaxID=614101 RepID=A0ABQ9GUP5_9NEOP|nr:hypothetical protein PR048_023669 [Dryococelus australis]
MKIFLALLLWMSMGKKPTLKCYWSKNVLYKINLSVNGMSRNRFEALLTMIHFSNNEFPLIDKLNNVFLKAYIPANEVCILEIMVPFRGTLLFQQYITGKRRFEPLRRSIKWYRKTVFELLLNTCLVNAYIVFNSKFGKTMDITAFRERLCAHVRNSAIDICSQHSLLEGGQRGFL